MTINASTLIDTIQNNGNKYTRSYTKQVREADEDVEDFQDNLVGFKKIVRKLHNYSSTNTTDDKVKSYLSDLADTYNTLVKNKDSITNSSLQKQLDKLDTLIDDNAKSLKKLGLKKTDGKLEFDEDTFDDDANTKTIKKLFEGTDSFGDQLFKITRDIDSSSSDAQYVTSERHLSSTTKYSDSDYLKANLYLLVQQGASLLNYYCEHSNNGTTIDYNDEKNTIANTLDSVVLGLNYTTTTDNLIKSYENNKDNLAKLGVSYDDATGKFSLDVSCDNTTGNVTYTSSGANYSIDADAFDAVFNSSEDSFYSALNSYSKDGFNNTMKTSTIGVTIDSYIDNYA
jgi:hypothetical protein